MCALMFPFWLNCRPHTVHAKGFSPVCTRKCSSRLDWALNAFPHKGHRTPPAIWGTDQ
ncbi:hypothetical protein DPMN_021528 [Dreissena polymorpha]|uniref:Uncharacterized protein n=1 Tax=Dreissena polymorpha TaxID=45954 RepID=A0A9D4NMV8_DREPO|nr:hypothetical protein DPMN_021528 [Dreissena polymorpha]